VAARRKLWRAAQPFLDPESLVFLDKTGVNTKMARLYGWAPVGERCRDKAPFDHWKTMTFVAGLRPTRSLPAQRVRELLPCRRLSRVIVKVL